MKRVFLENVDPVDGGEARRAGSKARCAYVRALSSGKIYINKVKRDGRSEK
jgi:hypothetical protein